MNAPDLDLIIPSYGGTDLLWRCLTHLWLFSPPGVRITVIDDCAPDRSPQVGDWLIASGLAAYHRHAENRGCTAAWNTGIKITEPEKAPFIGFINNDVLAMPGALETILGCMDAGAPFICAKEIVGEPGKPFDPAPLLRPQRPSKVTLTEHFFGGLFVLDRSVVDEVGGFDERMKQAFSDYDFLLRCHAIGVHPRVCEEALVWHGGSVSAKRQGLMKAMVQLRKDREVFNEKWKAHPKVLEHLGRQVPFEDVIERGRENWEKSADAWN